jgi:uroporphyrin-III C-methyltransferase/precorrin-2 dehydrogenase/sirohydrochlorin ferrochelatase
MTSTISNDGGMGPAVALIGAGPGDPELLTLKAVDRLQRADLVLYDALLEPTILLWAKQAHCFFVGKRAGNHSIAQADIGRLLVRAARRGKRVVRLKGGDPFVFGRGGEEALALAKNGIPFEIVPGISSATAAAASAAIPVTHRGACSGFIAVTGHDRDALRRALGGLSCIITVVVMMGWHHRRAISEILLDAGWPETLPVAAIKGAWTAQSARWTGTLSSLPEAPDIGTPTTIIVGEVVSVGARLTTAAIGSERLTNNQTGVGGGR